MNNLIIILYINKLILSNNVYCDELDTSNNYIVKTTDNESVKEYIGLTKTIDGKEIIYFLGIPYAEPPIGTLRFKRPVSYKYETAINATKWQHSCHQLIAKDPTGQTQGITKTLSEDCLYLNIWAPKLIPKQKLKAVIVFMHGGGFMMGTSTADVLNGEMVSVISDVVIVSMNYRLNVFGFLYSETPEAPGNVGLWDQVLALEWVRDNIKYFGGDPNKITLLGSSSGAWSASLHILSPVSRHLFRNAILMSGSPLTHLSGDDPKKALNRWNIFAKTFGCNSGISDNRTVNCLRKLKAKELFDKYQSRRDFISDLIGFVPLVVYGNEFLPKKPIESLKSFDFKQNFSLLSGFVDNEGLMIITNVDFDKWTSPKQAHFTKKEGLKLFKNYLLKMKTDRPINAEHMNQIYLSQIHENNTDLVKQRISTAIGDFYFTCPTNLFNKYVYSTDTANNKVFQYLFSAHPKTTQFWCRPSFGACHTTDMFMLFGHPLRYPDNYTDNEKSFSKSIINTFSHFAKYDKPPAQNNIEWQSFYKNKNTEDIVQPYYQFLLDSKPDGNFGLNYKDFECEKLWKPHIENQ